MYAQTVQTTDLSQEKNKQISACNFKIRWDMFLGFKRRVWFLLTQALKINKSGHIMSQFAQRPNCSNFANIETGKKIVLFIYY